MFAFAQSLAVALLIAASGAAEAQGPLPAPLSLPAPGPAKEGPYAPQAILQGGIVIPLYPPGSPQLKADRVSSPEIYEMSSSTPARHRNRRR
jgi:hypothetical protein